MKKLVLTGLSTCLLLIAFSGLAHAGEVTLKWGNWDDFTDVNPGNELKESLRERMVKDFGRVFSSQSQGSNLLWRFICSPLTNNGTNPRLDHAHLVYKDLPFPQQAS